MTNKTNVIVLDAPMGAGKSTAIIDMLNKRDAMSFLADTRYIIATPYLAEVTRYKDGIIAREFIEPQSTTAGGVKRNHFRKLVEEGKNIVTTHSLLGLLEPGVFELIKEKGYTLVVDEDLNAHSRIKFSDKDIEFAMNCGLIEYETEENKIIKWVYEEEYGDDCVFSELRDMAQGGVLYHVGKNSLVQTLSTSFYEAFTTIYQLTYLFEASDFCANLRLYNVPYVKKSVKDGIIVDYDASLEDRRAMRDLVNVYDGKLNDICGGDSNPFSSRWYNERAKAADFTRTKNAIGNYFRHAVGAKSKDVMWTCLKSHQSKLAGKGYTKGFVSLTMKASNEYADRTALAYVYNLSKNPYDLSFYRDRGVEVNGELFAVASFLQWVWRSAVRNGESVNLYLPSKRMRALFEAWANFEI